MPRKALSSRLLTWYDRHRRTLPWRKTSDPWAIWVSEVMLQQTRVEVVREAFPAFLERYSDPSAFARVDDEELLSAWKGLGYYRRARLLRDGARAVMIDHAGRVPRDVSTLGKLPGIGEYTQGAIASIAFQQPEPAVDGNVERVVARHRAITTDIKRGVTGRRLRKTVLGWMDRKRPGDFNQALMELGATVCTPRKPRCDSCPLAPDCEARKRGIAGRLPRLPARRPVEEVHSRVALAEGRNGRVLAYRIPTGEINAGQMELPGPGLLRSVSSANALAKQVAQRFSVKLEVLGSLVMIRHHITHHRITLTVHEARLIGSRKDLLSVRPDDPAVPWTTASRKVFDKLAAAAGL